MAPADTPLLDRLRSETRDAHEALHHHPLLAPLASPDVTLHDYRFALLAFQAFYSRMEPQAGDGAPVLDWLAHDLARQTLQPLALPGVSLPAITTESQRWGYLYVRQGSTLGGTVMSRNLRQALELNPLSDQKFFAGYGDENGRRWKKFIENLFATAPFLQPTETVNMAVACFRGVAAVCDAVLAVKDRHALQTPPGTDRSAT
ncbi:biliverdin-producing heme oxygenase [Asticcacaulis solisilvae]|uniref:biliverdin-producing heme oxygenase n=1 Tax=Asticcacaulis solisilvae TaxID=1217274 RepID=UPI003FD88A9E